MGLLARAVESYAEWAALEEAYVSRPSVQSESFTEADEAAYDQAQEAYRRFDEVLRCFFVLDLATVIAASKPYLDSDTPAEWTVAARVIGQTGAVQAGAAAGTAYELLFPRLLTATDQDARDVFASQIGSIWNALDDSSTPLALACHSNLSLRYAAAQALAMTTTDHPDDATARAALETLKDDPDEAIRSWANFGLETLDLA